MRLLPSIALGALLLSCGPAAPPSLTTVQLPDASRATAPPSDAERKLAGADTEKLLHAALCGQRTPCHVLRNRPAGLNEQGMPLSVVSLWTGEQRWSDEDASENEGEEGSAQKGASRDATALPADLRLEQTEREDVTSPGLGGCHRFDYWLVTWRDGAIAAKSPLLRICNDGHGASGVGEDTVTIGDNRFTHTVMGGSAWRWIEVSERRLSPLSERRTASSMWWNIASNVSESRWSWDDFAGGTTWYSPLCKADGSFDRDGDAGDVGPGDRGGREYAFATLPLVEVDPAYTASGWKSAGLGRCALAVDATGKGGFVTHGMPGQASDASLRVVATAPDTLLIEVEDDHLVGPGKNWVTDDHLEIWLSAAIPSASSHCVTPPEELLQWGIRVTDGKVFAGAGKPHPTALRVERAAPQAGESTLRFKVVLPSGQSAVTVVYSDSDDGRKQERLIATSKLVHGKGLTLGTITKLPVTRVTCGVKEGRLTPMEKPEPPISFTEE
ncbi:hypothetical protein [Chondromyces crocatus]|uniref:Uncharacterized protein n=1 Tax=Chondromyces crocatus TaxID=52 RepID=A0A0K1ETI0_CHOCO|nr:hypothetical protein [Chondromyces crocatus]AKT44161.1 uncharacterized protein CMC5_084010 [Chondromyces crocatus]